MQKIFVLMNMPKVSEQPVLDLASALEGMAGAQLSDALVIDVRDDLVDLVTRLLDIGGHTYWIRKDESQLVIPPEIQAARDDAIKAADAGEPDHFVWLEPLQTLLECFSPESGPAEAIEERHEQISEQNEDAAGALLEERPVSEVDGLPVPHPADADPSVEKPNAQKIHNCEHCREPFPARRKDQRYCSKKECQAAKTAAYNKRYQTRLQQEKELENVAEPEKVAEQPRKNGRMWLVEDGKQAGQLISEVELRSELEFGRLVAGQHVSNNRHGKCRVIQFKGKHPRLAIKQLFGEGADRIINLGQ